jgi:hypothetical protein
MSKEFSSYSFYQLIEDNHVVLAFQGMITNYVLTAIGRNLRSMESDEVLSKRIFGIVVELAQNINLHSAERSYSEADEREVGIGTIAISETEHQYRFSSGNMIDSSRVEDIQSRCKLINSLDDKQLRELFLEQRRMAEDKDSAGLIQMVRRSGNPLGYEFIPANDQHTFFILSVSINKRR